MSLSRDFSSFASPSRLSKKTSRPLLRRQAESCFDAIPQYTPENQRPFTPASRPPSRWLDDASASLSLPRLRSISWSSRSFKKSQKLSRDGFPLTASASSPPALDYALERCLLKDVLNIRSSSLSQSATQISRGRQSSTSKVFLEPQSTPKFLLLNDDGCILQYDLNGGADRAPELILELGPSSIAVASDDIPGRHWVLRITATTRHETSRSRSAFKALRPRLLSRTSDRGSRVSEMLIIFDSAHVFNSWLITVRKEIEVLGGLEYRPDSRGIEGEVARQDNNSTFNTRSRISAATFTFPQIDISQSASYRTSVSPQKSAEVRITSNQDRGREADTHSSVGTVTDLDVLRGSDNSDAASRRTGTRSSYADSVAAELSSNTKSANTMPNFTSRLSRISDVDIRSRRKKNIPHAIGICPDGRKRSSSCSPALPSPRLPRTPTLPPDAVHQMVGKFVRDERGSSESPIGASKMAEWLEKVATDNLEMQNPSTVSITEATAGNVVTDEKSGTEEEVMHFENFEYSVETSGSTTPRDDKVQTSGADSQLPELAKEETVRLDPPAYSFAPRRVSSLDFAKKRRSVSDPVLLSAVAPVAASPTLDSFPLPAFVQGRSRFERPEVPAPTFRRSRKALSVQVNKNFAGLDQLHLSERSPAVSDVHLATNFGVEQPFHKQSVQIAGESLDFPLTANRAVPTSSLASDEPATALPFRKQHIKRQQSMPLIIYRAVAPLSPPPLAPLPAVPASLSFGDQGLSPGKLRGRSGSPNLSGNKREELRHVRSATIDCLNRNLLSPLASHPPSSHEIRHARRISSISTLNTKPPSRQPSHNQTSSTASAIAAVAAQLQKMTTPVLTPSSPPSVPAPPPVSSPTQIESIGQMLASENDASTALPAIPPTTEARYYPFPSVTSRVGI